MQIIKYKGDYDRSEFYAIMGKFFAEKQYKKELPYIQNNDEREWWLLYQKNSLCAFMSLEKKKDRIDISNVYVLHEYRNTGLCKKMLRAVLKSFPRAALQTISNSEFYIKTISDIGFHEISQRGSYKIFMFERGDDND